jgi:hypothetical protein
MGRRFDFLRSAKLPVSLERNTIVLNMETTQKPVDPAAGLQVFIILTICVL